MLLDQDKYNIDSDVEFLFERPVGWSSACLDSTINYYLSHGSTESYSEDTTENDKS